MGDRKGLVGLAVVLASLIVIDQWVAQRFSVKATATPPAAALPLSASGRSSCGCSGR